ncbi:type II toxin-antitoxin system VapC family toxin [Nocardia alni]|uniref:type II toxin-antitoxin system VapC family toxin n=1 Tax=Nocardia alni TaxID=2815723 RepID=UPI001C23D3B2|nr:type II toxin-antitoxin system VapC family toxin [Nocardia alni]
MTETLVDTCVLLDVVSSDAVWREWSTEQIQTAIGGKGLVINPIVYAEMSIHFSTDEDLDTALPRHEFRREDLPWNAASRAGRAHRKYRLAGGAKTSPIGDFYIGAHAAVQGYRLLTRNRKDFRSYFPDLEIIGP